MPSPFGHLLSGVVIFSGFRKKKLNGLNLFILVLFFSILPDFDFLFGLVEGQPNKYHHHFTHSFFFVVFAGVIGAWIFARFEKISKKSVIWLFIMPGVVHLLLDSLAIDTSIPRGSPLFWPLWKEYFISPVLIFSDIQRSPETAKFFPSLFSRHNFMAVMIELLYLSPLLIFIIWKRNKTNVT
ncbi:metal-dependent hydrolase [candidate division KSB1 bacterium]|nr:metal-dependent hydrolase [candidate division KSB1 bacterium]